MAECPHFDYLLVVPHLRVQNANAISSPLTHGFPAMSAFLGLMWALERKTTALGLDVQFNAIGVVCHDYQEQVSADIFVKSFSLTRNPIDKDGKTAAIVEEGRIHLDISLVFAIQSAQLRHNAPGNQSLPDDITRQVHAQLAQMRIAGGSIVPNTRVRWKKQQRYIVALTGTDDDKHHIFEREKLRLLPGFTLVARDDLLEERHQSLRAQNPDTNRLDAWLSLSRTNWRCVKPEEDGKPVHWKHDRKDLGWLRPIPVGYGLLSGPHAPGTVANTWDTETPFCFVESLYSVGQWLSPHRLQSPRQFLWYADSQPDNGLYRCRNDYKAPVSDAVQYDFD